MSLFEFLRKEREHFIRIVEQDVLREKIWHCEPLLIVRDHEDVLFSGPQDVIVSPHLDKSADLSSETLKL